MSKFWNEDRVNELTAAIDAAEEVTVDAVASLADRLETTTRSIGAKLRSLGYKVQKASDARVSAWSEDATEELKAFVERNAGKYTYAEIAASFRNGEFTTKEVQGKILSLELTNAVKRTEATVAKVYSAEEEATLISMANKGASLEDIAEALGKELNSVRGKALSISRSVEGFTIPKQAKSYAKDPEVDPYVALGSDIAGMTVEEIAEKTGKTVRGVKTALTRRGISAANYDGAKKAAKNAEKAAKNSEA